MKLLEITLAFFSPPAAVALKKELAKPDHDPMSSRFHGIYRG